jgi:hypothetical protein
MPHKGLAVNTKALNQNFEYANELKEGRKIQTWTLSSQEAVIVENSGPPYYELLPMLLLSPSVIQFEEYTGSMSDWKSFGEFLYDINKGREIMPPVMVTQIHQMTSTLYNTL